MSQLYRKPLEAMLCVQKVRRATQAQTGRPQGGFAGIYMQLARLVGQDVRWAITIEGEDVEHIRHALLDSYGLLWSRSSSSR